jgi:cytoskeletal protein CcmA (bactofilin family)
MFAKTEPGRPGSGPAEAGEASAATVIGPGAGFIGDLSGDVDVVVQGRFEGKIRVEKNVKVRPEGEVEGDISARGVLVAGRVRGQIRASERAELAATAVVQGSVQSPKIVISEGAQLTGDVAMTVNSEKRSKSSEE